MIQDCIRLTTLVHKYGVYVPNLDGQKDSTKTLIAFLALLKLSVLILPEESNTKTMSLLANFFAALFSTLSKSFVRGRSRFPFCPKHAFIKA